MFPTPVTDGGIAFPKLVTDRRPCVTKTCNGPFLGEMLPRHSRHSIGRENMLELKPNLSGYNA